MLRSSACRSASSLVEMCQTATTSLQAMATIALDCPRRNSNLANSFLLLADTLGSVRLIVNEAGDVTLAQSYQPYGSVLASAGYGLTSYGFTGEWINGELELLYLRSRIYSSQFGRFTTKDTWQGNYSRPLSLNRWIYVEGNPINRVDLTGHYWWGAGQALWDASDLHAQSQNVHIRIQALWMLNRMANVHAEYTIPLTRIPVDLLNSNTGEMWEIKPWDDIAQAIADIQIRVVAMNGAQTAELLTGMSPVAMPYNWNFSPPIWFEGTSFPSEVYIGTDDSGWFDIYAGQIEPGVILWWKYRRLNPRRPVQIPINLPDRVTWSERNNRPGWRPTFVPVPAYGLFPIPGLEPLPLGYSCPTLPLSITIDPVTGAVIVGGSVSIGTVLWWIGKLLSPACGPFAPACAIGF